VFGGLMVLLVHWLSIYTISRIHCSLMAMLILFLDNGTL